MDDKNKEQWSRYLYKGLITTLATACIILNATIVKNNHVLYCLGGFLLFFATDE